MNASIFTPSARNTSIAWNNSQQCVRQYERFSNLDVWVAGIAILPILFLGLLANFAAILVFSRREMRRQMVNFYFLTLALSDSVLICSAFFAHHIQRVAQFTGVWTLFKISQLSLPTTNMLQNAAYFVTVWTTVGLSVHRCVGICFPFSSQRHLKRRNVLFYLLGVVAVSALFNGPRYFELKMEHCLLEPFHSVFPMADQIPEWVAYYKWRSFVEMAVFFAVPFAALITANVFIIRALRSAQQFRVASTRSARKKEEKEVTISKMCALIIGVFLFCNIGVFVSNFLLIVDFASFNHCSSGDQLSPFAMLLVLSNSLLNAVVYSIYLPKYFRGRFRAESTTAKTSSWCETKTSSGNLKTSVTAI